MEEKEKQQIIEAPKVVEGEVIEKSHTRSDLELKWSEVKQTWHNGVERVKTAIEESKQQKAARQMNQQEKPAEEQPYKE